MIYIDLILNLTLLIALSIVSGFIEKHWKRQTALNAISQGILFGGAAVIGMLRPFNLGPGLIFDGRSVMVSLCAMFFGPLAASVASIMPILCRISLGGAGTLMGVMVIVSSAGIGLLAYFKLKPDSQPPSTGNLYLFGILVHIAMLAMTVLLPKGTGIIVLKNISLPVMLLYPLATILVGKILSDQVSAARTIVDLRKSEQNLAITLQSIGDAVISTNIKEEIVFMNPAAEKLTGWAQSEATGRNQEDVFRIISEKTRQKAENPVTRALREGVIVGLANHTLLITKEGIEIPIADSAAPIRDTQGKITGVVLVFRDQSEQHRMQYLLQLRLTLLEYATTHTLEELLTKALDEISAIVSSPIGFYHFVEADQKTLSLQQWSSRTLQEFCQAEGKGKHYSIDKAGVWVDCVHQKKPVVHNNYASMTDKKGLPEGHAPVIRELVVPIMRNGAVVAILGVGNKPSDYSANDVETVAYLADVTWQIVDQKRTEKVLQQSERKYRDLFENAPIGIFSTSSQGQPLAFNNSIALTLGCNSIQEAMKHYTNLQTQLYTDPVERTRFLNALQKNGRVENFASQVQTVDGRTIWLNINARISRKSEDGLFSIEGFATDITAHRKLEDQFVQAQKMESIGRLAGGVAHDYNNMLSVILGYTELALEEVAPSAPLHEYLQEILMATRRSTEVTRQLLAFARKQTIAPRVINLNDIVDGMLKMLGRLIGENIGLSWSPKTKLWPINIDPSQLDQILANLCVNARDAIAKFGKISIETDMVHIDKDCCDEHPGFITGDFVLLSVSDDGSGMNKDVLDKLFEPFFTTKEVGHGTGLGLATVYGIVKQNEGFIDVFSEPGKGTTFKIYLPRFTGEKVECEKQKSEETQLGHGETILIVEDEFSILNLSKTMLAMHGYDVLATSAVSEAIRLAEINAGRISLLITDVIMPEMNGRELADKLTQLVPNLKLLFMSGYTADVIASRGVLEEGVCFIQKPFSMNDLLAKVQEILEQNSIIV